jgi:hypothetical protein
MPTNSLSDGRVDRDHWKRMATMPPGEDGPILMVTARDPARLAAQRDLREPAIADTYAMIVRARINRLPGAR